VLEKAAAGLPFRRFHGGFETVQPPPYIPGAKQYAEGGDPVSHCHDLRLNGAATWIDASGEVRLA